MEEIWKDIEGTNGAYQVSNLGRVRSMARRIVRRDGKIMTFKTRILKGFIDYDGYHKIIMWINSKMYKRVIHRYVAIEFIPNPDNLPQVNHKDGNRANNNIENLEWVTAAQNTQHSYDVLNHGHWACKILCNETGEIFNSCKEAGEAYDIPASVISRVSRGLKSHYQAHGLTFKVLEKHYVRN